MDRFSAACTSGFAADNCSAGRAEFIAAATTAPAGSTKPSSTTLVYFESTRLSVAIPTPIQTYAIMAARIGPGNSCAMKVVRPLTTTAKKMMGVHNAKPAEQD